MHEKPGQKSEDDGDKREDARDLYRPSPDREASPPPPAPEALPPRPPLSAMEGVIWNQGGFKNAESHEDDDDDEEDEDAPQRTTPPVLPKPAVEPGTLSPTEAAPDYPEDDMPYPLEQDAMPTEELEPLPELSFERSEASADGPIEQGVDAASDHPLPLHAATDTTLHIRSPRPVSSASTPSQSRSVSAVPPQARAEVPAPFGAATEHGDLPPTYVASRQEHHDEPYARSYNYAPTAQETVQPVRAREPLAAVVGVGLVAEHIARKRSQRKQQEQMDQTREELSTQQQEMAADMQQMRRQQRSYRAEQASTAPYAPTERFSPAEQRPGTPAQQRPERQPVPPQAQEQREQPFDEPLVVGPDKRVEHSAWHSIAVDRRGHEVTGAIAYGREFHRQRKHEMLQDRAGDGTTNGAASGQPAILPPYYQDSLPSGLTETALPQGQSTHVDPQHQLPAHGKKQVSSNITNPWFWLMLALIVGAFFAAALI